MVDLLALTSDLIAMPSESFSEGPFVDWLEAELVKLDHLDVVRVGDNIVARSDLGRDQRVLLVGHTDTVPANGNALPRLDGDVLWGLGATDMKGGLAVFLDLARTVTDPVVDLTFVFYAREEVAQAHNGLNEILAERPDLLTGDCAIVGEPTDAAIEAGCQGAMRVEIVLAGARAHTARPWMGRNAIHRMAGILETLSTYEARTPTIDGCTYREAAQAVSIDGGVAGNVVPDRCVLHVHHRYAPDRNAEQAEAFLRELLAPHLENGDSFTVLDVSPACAPSLGHPLFDRLIKANDLPVKAKLGWTDVARFDQLGVPATNFGPGDPALAHNADERLERRSIETVHAALVGLISRAG
ncbi:MAG: succinyl-diaminopimelate desuccinylase [Acidimicrobiia bacterium]|nr:succinyl-diaminopimelate desuccinylase [Acidimicrobiia bacterium]